MIRVAIVGTGMAGLACARRLASAGVAPVLFDKGRGPGGRLATRRAEGLQFDHGAQYVTARDPGFAGVLQGLQTQGVAAPWPDGSGRTRLVGVPGMSGLARAMAQGLDVRQQRQVTSIRPVGTGWVLQAGDQSETADIVVLTIPAPQIFGVLGQDHPMVAPLAAVRLAPCLTLMAAIEAAPTFVMRRDPEDDLAWIAQDSHKPGRRVGPACTWVAQASPAFSECHLEDDLGTLTARMLPLLCDRLGVLPDRVTFAAAHRWRYARVATPFGQPFLRYGDRLYAGGDWCLGPKVESAWISGDTIAADILARLG